VQINAVHLFAMETPPCPAHQIRFFSGINLIPGAYLDNYNFQKNNRAFKNLLDFQLTVKELCLFVSEQVSPSPAQYSPREITF